MKTYWCTKKNSIKDWIEKGIDFDPALTPCLMAEGELWEDGECCYLHKAIQRK
ncbi:MAG: hypothetical protein ABSE07_01320 [Methanoregula sp.]|jgi:hypothetical protein